MDYDNEAGWSFVPGGVGENRPGVIPEAGFAPVARRG